MQLALKIVLSVLVILAATEVGKRVPSMGGLIAVMPLTGALALVWTYLDKQGDAAFMQTFTKGAVWGILPSVLFFVVALLCFRRQLGLSAVLAASFGAWLAAALVHQWLLR